MNSWDKLLQQEYKQDYFLQLKQAIDKEYSEFVCFPPKEKIFNALTHCPFDKTKVVIIGQDPYHGIGQASGLCFSVQENVKIPPSLKNIFKEIKSDLGIDIPTNGNLERWAEQGVLLMNSILTVRSASPGSHKGYGWEMFTDKIIKLVSDRKRNVVFLLWGAHANSKSKLIDESKHLILKSKHPSPLSAYKGFFGCQHFSKTNLYLQSKDISPINW